MRMQARRGFGAVITPGIPLRGYVRRIVSPGAAPMSEDNPKTPLDHVGATLSQLKEMRHYSKTNVEHLTAQWLLFDGELKKLKKAKTLEDLMERQGQLHDALEAAIAEFEELSVELTPAPEEEDSAG
jgi:hypothetical protein